MLYIDNLTYINCSPKNTPPLMGPDGIPYYELEKESNDNKSVFSHDECDKAIEVDEDKNLITNYPYKNKANKMETFMYIVIIVVSIISIGIFIAILYFCIKKYLIKKPFKQNKAQI